MRIDLKKLKIFFIAVLIFSAGLFVFGNVINVHAQSIQSDFGLEQVGGATGLGQQDLRVTIASIIRTVLGFLGILALLIVLYGGFVYMTAGGNEQKVSTAKKILINGGIGLVLILSAFAITQFVLTRLAEATGYGGGTSLTENCVTWGGCSVTHPECCGSSFGSCTNLDDQFVVKSITPHTPAASTGMNNFAIRTIFSQGLDPAYNTIDQVFATVDRDGADVKSEFDMNFIDTDRKVVELVPNGPLGNYLGDYDISVSSDLVSSGGLDLETDDICGEFPLDAGFLVDVAVDDTEPPEILDLIDDSDPATGDITYRGIASGGRIALPQNGSYEIAANMIDDHGIGYVEMVVQRHESDGTPIGAPQKVVYDGPRLSRGSEATLSDPYNFVNYLIIDGSYPLRTDPAYPDSYYTITINAYDIDHNVRSVSSEFDVVANSCTFPDGFGTDPSCRGTGACDDDSDCLSGVCDETIGMCIAVPIINEVNPWDGAEGNWVTILGNFFGEDQGRVFFNGIQANLPSCDGADVWHDNYIIAEVPGAALAEGSGIVVRVDHELFVSDPAGHPDFYDTTDNDRGPIAGFTKDNTLIRPGLCSVLSNEPGESYDGTNAGLPGSNVIASGNNLGDTADTITFGGIQGNITAWTTNQIDAVVPENLNRGRIGVIAKVGAESSNGVPYQVLSEEDLVAPLIESIDPSSITLQSYVTIKGQRFGNTAGTLLACVDTGATDCLPLNISLPSECGSTWTDTQIIAEVPAGFPLGSRYIVVENGVSGLQNSPTEVDRLNVIAGSPLPSICALTPSSGSAPLLDGDVGLNILGINFSANPTVYFWGRGSEATDNSTWLSLDASAVGTGLQSVTTQIPVDYSGPVPPLVQSNPIVNNDGFSMFTGPIKLESSLGAESNSVLYSVTDCRNLTSIPTGMHCCTEGDAQGSLLYQSLACPGVPRDAGYVWRFTTGKIPEFRKVLEICDNDTAQFSPTPRREDANGENVCLNRQVQVEFNDKMNPTSFAGNVLLYTCGTGDEPTGCVSIDEVATVDNYDDTNNVLTIRDNPTVGDMEPNTWYHVELLNGIQGRTEQTILGVPTVTYSPIRRTSPCSDASAYCFDFKTGPAGTECILEDVAIKPMDYTVARLGLVLDNSYPVDDNVEVVYKLFGRGDQECSAVSVGGYDWNWTTDLPAYARADADPENNTQATAYALQEPPGNRVVINAEDNAVVPQFSADSNLNIVLGPPKIVEYWPDCAEACGNTTIGARFNRDVDPSFYEAGIHLYKCGSSAEGGGNTCINTIADFDPEVPVAPTLPEVPFSVIDDTNRMVAEIIPNTALPGDSLDPDTSYLVYFDNSILSVGEVDEDNNIISNGKPLEPKMWTFKTKSDGTFCMADDVEIKPDPFTASYIGQKTKYSSYPYTNPDQCSPVGQKLNPWSFGWNWDTSDHDVAEVSNFIYAGELKPFCGLGCLPKGSDISLGSTISPLCGNGVIDPGESCDDGENNGVISGQTFEDWNAREIGNYDTYSNNSVGNYGARGIDVVGNLVYVSQYGGTLSRFQVIDATDPSNPVLRGSLPVADLSIGLDTEVVDGKAYIASYYYNGNAGESCTDDSQCDAQYCDAGQCPSTGALVVVDVSNPDDVSIDYTIPVPYYNTYPPYPLEVTLLDGYAYVGEYRGNIDVIDTTNPSRGIIQRSHEGYINDIKAFERGGSKYLYAIYGNHFNVFDITDQEAPLNRVIIYTPGRTPRSVDVVGNYAYVADLNYGFEIFDISNPMAPVLVNTIESGSYASRIRVFGDYLFLSNYNQYTVSVYNISDVDFPILVGEYSTDVNVMNMAASGNRVYLAKTTEGVSILDTSQRLYCSSNCGSFVDSFCGNGVLEPGEDCDIGIAGETVGQSCSLDCLRPGNDNISCGNNIVEPNLGEECDPGPTSDTRVGCSSRCTHLGSTTDPAEATGGLPLCGDGEITVGEDCEAGINGEVGSIAAVAGSGGGDVHALWHFNESSGQIIDATTYNNNGTQSGGVTYGQTGKFGGALGFDGINDSVSVLDSNSLRTTDNFSFGGWINPNFTPGTKTALVVEGQSMDGWVSLFETLGYNVVVNTDITNVSEIDAVDPDVVACFKTAWACTKTDLLDNAYTAGYSIFTEGNDNNAGLRPIASSVGMNDPSGQIVPTGSHPLSNGWTTTPNSGGDWRQGITSLNPNAYAIAADDTLDYVEAIYLEEAGMGRWFHIQPSSVGDQTLVENALNYLTRQEIISKGNAYNLFLNDQTLTGFINNYPVSTDITTGWNYVDLVYNGSTESLYVNGSLADSNSFSEPINSNTADVSIGKGYSGLADEFQVWNLALNSSQISDLYNADSELQVDTTSDSSSKTTAGFTCSSNCLHIGTDLSREWCDDNPSWSDSTECLGATSVCGNGHLESGEECEIIGNQFYVFDGGWGIDANDNGRLVSDILPADFNKICSDKCLLQDICDYPSLAPLYCNPVTQEGCKSDCTLQGSSVEKYAEPSLCGDGVVGIGEYGWCEYTPAELAAFDSPGQNPVQSVRAVGLGELDPATQLQSALIESNIVRVRGESEDLSAEQQDQLSSQADYYLQCGFEEFYDSALPGIVSSWSAEGNADDNQELNNCTLMNGTGFTSDGAAGSAFSFDGVDDYVYCGVSDSLAVPSQITMEAWFRIPDYLPDYAHRMILQNRNSANYLSLVWSRPMMSLRIDGLQRTVYSNFTPELNVWNHVVGTYDGSMLRIYVNGVLRNTAGPFSGPITYWGSSSYGTYIGQNYAGNYLFNGDLDEIAIYNRALSGAEVLANYTSASSRENYNLCPTAGYGVGYNSCCYPRPTRTDEYPPDGSGILDTNDVCLNSFISVTFDGDINETTLANNVVLAKGYTSDPPADCVSLTNTVQNTLAYANISNLDNSKDSFFDNLWNTFKKFFAWLIGDEANASSTNVAGISYWCRQNLFNGIPQVSKVKDSTGKVIESTADIYLNDLLDADSYYAVVLLGGRYGIKDIKGVGIGNPDDVSKADDSFLFLTGDQICKISTVTVIPDKHFYSTPNTEANFRAVAESTSGQLITAIAGVYDWEWFWTPSADSIFAIVPDEVTSGTAPNRTISSTELQGSKTIGAHATVIADVDTEDNQVGQVFTGTADLTSFFCENPWPPRDNYPFQDEEGNDDGTTSGEFNGLSMAGTGASGDQYFNYEMGYCADSGLSGTTIDDLPYLKPFVFNTVDGLPDAENLKRILFFNDINDDVIGLQIFKTEDAVNILDKESLNEWFARKIGIVSGFSQASVDGYDALTNGSNYYVSFINTIEGPTGHEIYNNIFVFSINENAQQNTYNVFDQLINSLKFNSNLSDDLYCEGATSVLCFTDFDCMDTLGNATGTPPGSGVCLADKTKMKRDWSRLETISIAQRALNSYVSSTGRAPELKTGTYIPGKTRSVWPSWGNLGQGIGSGIGVDPINAWTSCSYCHVPGTPISGTEQLCAADEDCTGTGEICVAIDSQTCWDEINSRFICPAQSSIFGYKFDSATLDYEFYANLEYFNSDDLENFVDVDHFRMGSICGAGGTTESPLSGNCGNGVVNPGEECDPPGQINTIVNGCIDPAGATLTQVCNNSCIWQDSGCNVEKLCGNGRVDDGEQCDDGTLNGTPGNCSAGCTFSTNFCGDGTQDSYCSFNNVYCTGNPNVCLTSCGTNRNCQAMNICSPVEFCDLGANNGDYLSPPGTFAYNGNSCSTNCKELGPRCGDGVLQIGDKGEACVNGLTCDSGVCSGEGICTALEECDDGNITSGDGCANNCKIEAAPVVDTTPVLGECGNGVIDLGEACDRGINNGVQCTPSYNQSCNYCSWDCKKVLYIEPDAYCGNKTIDVMSLVEYPDSGNAGDTCVAPTDCDSGYCIAGECMPLGYCTDDTDCAGSYCVDNACSKIESCEYIAPNCSSGTCTDPYIVTNSGTLDIDQCSRQSADYNLETGIYSTFTGNYECRNSCRFLNKDCTPCGSELVTQGGASPDITVLNPMVLTDHDSLWGTTGGGLFTRFYFRDYNEPDETYFLSHDGSEAVNYVKIPHFEEIVKPQSIFSDDNIGLISNSACSDVYKVCFSPGSQTGDDGQPLCLCEDGDEDNNPDCIDENGNWSDFLWDYKVNNDVNNIYNEYVISPAVPEGTIRIVLKWTKAEAQEFGGTKFTLGALYSGGADTYASRKLPTSDDTLCVGALQEDSYWVPNYDSPTYAYGYICEAWPKPQVVGGNHEGIYMHEVINYGDTYEFANTYTQAITINAPDTVGADSFLEDAPYAIFVQALGGMMPAPMAYFDDANIQVDIYEYEPIPAGGSPQTTIFKPTRTYQIKYAEKSGNPGAQYWHLLNIVRDVNDIDGDGDTNDYAIVPVNKIVTGAEEILEGSSIPAASVCGDGRVDGTEVCDPSIPGQENCLSTCDGYAVCGNGNVEANEECDTTSDGCALAEICNSDCQCSLLGLTILGQSTCGDGIVNGDEVCDLGEEYNGICGCNSTCTGNIEEGTFPPALLPICTVGYAQVTSECGDGIVNGDEVCDAGTENNGVCNCNSTCTATIFPICMVVIPSI